MSIVDDMKKELVTVKNKKRSNFYLTARDFNINNKYVYDNESLYVYGGRYNIPHGSAFYNEILTEEYIDVLADRTKVMRIINSNRFKKLESKKFTKLYIKPVKKYLAKHKVFNEVLLRKLIRLKVIDNNKYKNMIDKLGNNPSVSRFILNS